MTDVVLLVGLLAGASGVPVEVVTTQGEPQLLALDRPDMAGEPSTLLVGRRLNGRLQTLTRSTLTIQTDDGPQTVAVRDLLRLRFGSSEDDTTLLTDDRDGVRVRLTDGSLIPCEQIEVRSEQAVLKTRALGTVRLPASAIRSLRFAPDGSDLDSAWQALHQRSFDRDVLVVAKKTDGQSVLDHLAGAVGDIRDGSVQFLLDNQAVPLKLSKLFGIIYHRRQSKLSNVACRVDLQAGGRLLARSVSFNGQQLTVELEAARVTAQASRVAAIDFSPANVRYLSDMEPRHVEYTPYFDITWKYRRDQNLDGAPLRIDGRTFSRGLCIHSRTVLHYYLNGNFRRFLAVMGIDQAVRPLGDVHVTISGDRRTLLDADVRGTDPARIVDLDVTGVRMLQIHVDFGKNLDIADHLDLADAKVVK